MPALCLPAVFLSDSGIEKCCEWFLAGRFLFCIVFIKVFISGTVKSV